MRCSLRLENGKKVLARGRISLYEPRGEYQFIVDGLRDAGEGRLQQLFELLKKKLEAEGLFAAARKKPLPPYPWRIGVITSPSGAAIRDILQVLERRWPVAQVRLYPVSVQGSEAPGEIRAALTRANKEGWAELLILGRGGGSLEDLQAFNEESVARSVAASAIPLISAVGHETDFSICDFVADLRAPTPSAAAELATPDGMILGAEFTRYGRMLEQRMRGQLQRNMQSLDYLAHRLSQRDPALQLREQGKRLVRLEDALQRAARGRLRQIEVQLNGLSARMHLQHPDRKLQEYRRRVQSYLNTCSRLIEQHLERSRDRLQTLGRTLHAVSPLATMGRGYAVLSATASGTIVTAVSQIGSGDRLSAQLSDGRLYCIVDSVSKEPPES
jgi:exodeoxyribonuclease VII large subunit